MAASQDGHSESARARSWRVGPYCYAYSLVLFTFWSQFKPSEPFLVDFLIDMKGLSNAQIFQDIFPLFTYAKLPSLLLIGMLSELWYINHSYCYYY